MNELFSPDSQVPVPNPNLHSLFGQRSEELDADHMGPHEIKMKKELSKLIGSKYPDTFDWSIYDKIAKRFGEEEPRGGVVFRTGLKLVNHHSSCSKCHYAFEIDTYGRGCIHDCSYCYAKEQLTRHGFWNRPYPMPLDLAEIRKIFYTVFETNKNHKWRDTLQARIPLRIGSMSDSFMWMDRRHKVTLELLKILKFYNYPFVIFTRSDLVAQDEYMAAMSPELAAIQFSICGLDETLTKLIEPGSPSVKRRFDALKHLSSAGFWTTVRLNPLFPTYPDGYFSDQQHMYNRLGAKELPSFRLFDIDRVDEFVDRIAEAKVPTLLAGFVRLSRYAIGQLKQSSKFDLDPFFRTDIPQSQNDRRYSDAEIAAYYRILHRACAAKGVRFSTCYIGNGLKDYFSYQKLWSNKSDCCDVMNNVGSFKKTSQELEWDFRLRFAPNKAAALNAEEQELLAEKAFSLSPIAHEKKPLSEIHVTS